jgi:hypothetical protein
VGVEVEDVFDEADGAAGLAELLPLWPPQPAASTAEARATIITGADKLLLTTCSST